MPTVCCLSCCLPPVLTGFAPFSIRHLLQFDLLEQLPKLQVVSAAASKEVALDKALSKMQADWQGVEFRVVEYKDTGTYVVGGTDEVQVSSDWDAVPAALIVLQRYCDGRQVHMCALDIPHSFDAELGCVYVCMLLLSLGPPG